jgi:hypothetical protein
MAIPALYQMLNALPSICGITGANAATIRPNRFARGESSTIATELSFIPREADLRSSAGLAAQFAEVDQLHTRLATKSGQRPGILREPAPRVTPSRARGRAAQRDQPANQRRQGHAHALSSRSPAVAGLSCGRLHRADMRQRRPAAAMIAHRSHRKDRNWQPSAVPRGGFGRSVPGRALQFGAARWVS